MEHCTLCPRQCGALRTDETGTGFCRLPSTMVIARIAPHLWEEPPISGTRGTGAVFFSGCTLRCVFCQNGDISHRNLGRPFTPQELADSFRRLEDMGVHTLSLITATPHIYGILEALNIYRPKLPIVWNTSGYETVNTLKLLEGVVDIYLPDLKHFSAKMGQLCAGASDYYEVATKAIQEMVRQVGVPQYRADGIMEKGVAIRHLILPGLTSESISLLTWVKETLPAEIPVSLMRQYIPCNNVSIKGLDRPITAREYHRVREHFEALGLIGFTQEATSASADFVPVFGQDESFI